MDAVAADVFETLYPVLYFGLLAAVALWEAAAPCRPLSAPLRRRWPGNFGATVLNMALVWVLFPGTAVSFAVWAEAHDWGLLRHVESSALAFLLAIVGLDFGRYLLHRSAHHIPLMWRLHRIDHSDPDYDFTTGLRFHPAEALLTVLFGFVVIAALGPPVAAVVAFELAAIAVTLFAHANARLPRRLDAALRLFIVTPDLHRVHHSADARESNSNFGAITPWWDRLLGSYTAQPGGGHMGMRLGLAEYRGFDHLRLDRMLLDPLRSPPHATAAATDLSAPDRASSRR